MLSDLDFKLHELSRIICTSKDNARVNAAAAEHRLLCRQHTVMPSGGQRKTVADVDAGVTLVLDTVRQLYAATNAPVAIGDIAAAAGISNLYAGIYVRRLVEADHLRTTHSKNLRITYAIPL